MKEIEYCEVEHIQGQFAYKKNEAEEKLITANQVA